MRLLRLKSVVPLRVPQVRKINAEQRPRYKGRFIKQEELAALKGRGHSG